MTDADDIRGRDESRYRAVLDRLREDIREAEAEVASLRSRLAEVHRGMSGMRGAADSLAALLGDEPAVIPGPPVAPRPARRIRHVDAATRVLREAGGPMRLRELAGIMASSGHALPSDRRRREATIGGVMCRYPHVFERVSHGVYALKGDAS